MRQNEGGDRRCFPVAAAGGFASFGADVVKRRKAEHKVTIRTMVHKELPRLSHTIRVAAHVYNNEEDIDKCLAAMKAVLS